MTGPNCDSFFFTRAPILECQLTTCSERVNNVYTRCESQSREALVDKLDSFAIRYMSEQKLFKIFVYFDFETTCVPEENFKNTETTTWIWKYNQISVSSFSKLVEEPIFRRKSDAHHLVASFLAALENLASQGKMQMKDLFLDLKTAIKCKQGSILEKRTQRHNRREPVRRLDKNQDDWENRKCASAQPLQIEKMS